MESLATFSAKEVKRATVEKREEYLSTEVRVEVKNNVIPISFLKIEERRSRSDCQRIDGEEFACQGH